MDFRFDVMYQLSVISFQLITKITYYIKIFTGVKWNKKLSTKQQIKHVSWQLYQASGASCEVSILISTFTSEVETAAISKASWASLAAFLARLAAFRLFFAI